MASAFVVKVAVFPVSATVASATPLSVNVIDPVGLRPLTAAVSVSGKPKKTDCADTASVTDVVALMIVKL